MEKGVEPAWWRAVGGFFPPLSDGDRRVFLSELFILKRADYRRQWQAATFSNERRRRPIIEIGSFLQKAQT